MTSKPAKATAKTKTRAKAKNTAPAEARRRATEKIAAQRRAQARRNRRNRVLVSGAAVAAALVVLAGLFALYDDQAGTGSGDVTPRSDYQVGEPSPGEQAPDFTLTSSTGGKVSLSDYRGQTVLLYFQEGVGCQPCFDQITDLEKQADDVADAGIDQIISITTNAQHLIDRKVEDMELTTPVLSDPDVAVSESYDANKYRMAMMGPNFNGHTFIVVGPNGTITWRADYGGQPKEIMYVPVNRLLNDIAAGNR